ncbi:MAG: iron-sulfur cluster assembly accessory protein [Acidobacteria bacterium]|nr:iron-sulfur cluster assembly accessory protein [Acidobacteriota bacterium]
MSISVSTAAAAKVKEMLAKKGEIDSLLRIRIIGGGCSGLQYNMDFIEKPEEGDEIVEQDGIRVCIDPKSALILKGTTLDYSDALMGGGFKLKNPNATSTCGCGESFSV